VNFKLYTNCLQINNITRHDFFIRPDRTADGTPDWNTDKLSMYCVINLKRFQIGTIEVEHCSVARLSLNICILIKKKSIVTVDVLRFTHNI